MIEIKAFSRFNMDVFKSNKIKLKKNPQAFPVYVNSRGETSAV